MAQNLVQFMGRFTTRRDAKGRLSVPAPFRSAMKDGTADGSMSLILRPSHIHPCIEAWPAQAFGELAASVDRLEELGTDKEDMATTLYADAWGVEPDKEGRMIVPDDLVRHANLSDSVFFLGRGKIFQIWEPEAGERRILEARQGVAARKLVLPGDR